MKHSSFELYKIDGVGVDLSRFKPVKDDAEKNALREKYGFNRGDFILLYTAEFIPRKNHALLFKVFPALKKKIPELKLALCGKGELMQEYTDFARANGMNDVTFAGYTKDIPEWCALSDVFVMPSLQEGMPVALLEAMASGLPVVASGIRGHTDVVSDCVNGFLFGTHDTKEFSRAIWTLYKNPSLRSEMGARNTLEARKYSVDTAVQKFAGVYRSVM